MSSKFLPPKYLELMVGVLTEESLERDGLHSYTTRMRCLCASLVGVFIESAIVLSSYG